jgi:hypothetical protein
VLPKQTAPDPPPIPILSLQQTLAKTVALPSGPSSLDDTMVSICLTWGGKAVLVEDFSTTRLNNLAVRIVIKWFDGSLETLQAKMILGNGMHDVECQRIFTISSECLSCVFVFLNEAEAILRHGCRCPHLVLYPLKGHRLPSLKKDQSSAFSSLRFKRGFQPIPSHFLPNYLSERLVHSNDHIDSWILKLKISFQWLCMGFVRFGLCPSVAVS